MHPVAIECKQKINWYATDCAVSSDLVMLEPVNVVNLSANLIKIGPNVFEKYHTFRTNLKNDHLNRLLAFNI